VANTYKSTIVRFKLNRVLPLQIFKDAPGYHSKKEIAVEEKPSTAGKSKKTWAI